MFLDIAITGCGSISAAGADAEAACSTFSKSIVRNEVVGSALFPDDFSAPCFRVQTRRLEPFSKRLSEGLHIHDTNRTILLALTAIEEALSRAGLSIKYLQGKRVGIALGTTVGCTFNNEEYYKVWRSGDEPDPAPMNRYLASNLAERIQQILGVAGPRMVLTNACASGTDAIGLAKSWLEHNHCDIAIAGGADELSKVACHGFKSLMLVSEENCRPFDKGRQGLNLGEGAGVLVMETEKHASDRKAHPIGWLRGYGIAGDAYHPTAPHPEGRGLQLAVRKAINQAGIPLSLICMINAHGTGTPANDRAETAAISALGFDASNVPVVSTKGVTGHALGAAGGIEAVFTLMALIKGEISGTTGCLEADTALPFAVLRAGEREALWGRLGLSQSLAFGGSNSALVIEGVTQ